MSSSKGRKRRTASARSSSAKLGCFMERAISAFLSASKRADGTSYLAADSSSLDFDGSTSSGSPWSSALLADIDPLRWEQKVYNHISNKSGVMHFPKSIGRLIPDSKKTIALNDNSTKETYECTIGTAPLSRGEKYLAGEAWLAFVKDNNLKVGDILKMKIGGSPPAVFVDIVREGFEKND